MSFLAAKSKQELEQWIILMYHKVGDECSVLFPSLKVKVFERQIKFLYRFYQLVSLEDLFSAKTGKGKKTRIAITFDDGYHCIYKYAYPILRKYGIPATIFLTVDSIEKNIPIWPDLLSYYINITGKEKIELTIRGNKFNFKLSNEEERLNALSQIKKIFKKNSDIERLLLMDELKDKLNIDGCTCESLAMLSWKEINDMAKNNINFGGHTLTHPILTKLSLDKIRYEIFESKKIIEEKIGKPIYSFAYPNGQYDDFNSDVKNILKDAGCKLACTTIFGKNDKNSDPFELKRVYTSGNNLIKFILRLRKA